jgi:hypothetical protein
MVRQRLGFELALRAASKPFECPYPGVYALKPTRDEYITYLGQVCLASK